MNYSRLNYFILLVTFGFLFFLFRVEPKPTYDPFDDLLRLDVDELYRDCHPIFREHRSYALRYEADTYYIDYETDGKDKKDEFVSARESFFPLDTLAKKYFIKENYLLRDTIPIPVTALSRFEETIGKFGFEIDTIFQDSVQISSSNRKDTIVLQQWNSRIFDDSLIIRQYWYRVETPLNLEQKVMKWLMEEEYEILEDG